MRFGNFIRDEKGLTMVDLSIVLVVLGLIMVPLIQWYEAEHRAAQLNYTEGQFNGIKDAINIFVKNNGRYPRPADFNLTEGQVGYGLEYANGVANPPLPAMCPDLATDGVCATNGPQTVLIGAVPFQNLALNEDLSLDYWQNKITYAVTASQTDTGAGTYTRGNGQVILQFVEQDNTISTAVDTYDMILISHGEQGQGAYTKGGNLVGTANPCAFNIAIDPPPVGADREDENCDLDNVFLNDRILGGSGVEGGGFAFSSVEGIPDFYDDQTSQQFTVNFDTWFQNEVAANYSVSEASRIGIGTPDPQRRIHVRGDIETNQNVRSPRYCNEGGNNCFMPRIIAATQSNMNCLNGANSDESPIVAIGSSRVYCGETRSDGGTQDGGYPYDYPGNHYSRRLCDSVSGVGANASDEIGQLMIGIEIDAGSGRGRAICAIPPG